MTNNYIKFFCLLCCFFIGCSEKETTPWRLNKEYSAWLTSSSGNYKAMMNKDIAHTVDAIQIYKIKIEQAPQYGLSWIFNQELIYETDNKKFIEGLFSAAQEKIEYISSCSENNIDDDKFYIVALDNTFMRAGVFIFEICNVDDKISGIIRRYSLSNSIYSNIALIDFFRNINILTN